MSNDLDSLVKYFRHHKEQCSSDNPTYPDQLKVYVAEAINDISQVRPFAKKIGVHPTTIKNWIKRYSKCDSIEVSEEDLVPVNFEDEIPAQSIDSKEEKFTSVNIISISLKLPNSTLASSLKEALSGVLAAGGDKC